MVRNRSGATKHSKKVVAAAIKTHKGCLYVAASALRIAYPTLWKYIKRWPDLKQVIREARGKVLDVAEGKLYELAESGDFWAIKFLLATQGKKRGYVERTENRIAGSKNGPPIRVENAVPVDSLNLPIEVRQQILDALRAAKTGNNGNGR